MKYFKLNNGILMPVVGLGTWQTDGKSGEYAIMTAVEKGYRLFDTAQMYGNEDVIGKALKNSRLERKNFFLTTKLFMPSTGYKKALSGIEESLEKLQTDYIDLMLIHGPYKEAEEMYEAMKYSYSKGKLKAVGLSNFNSEQFSEFVKVCGIIPQVLQSEIHVYYFRESTISAAQKCGTQMQAWSPLTSGRSGMSNDVLLSEIGKKYNKTAAQIALKYLIMNNIAVIPKSKDPSRMSENIDLFDFELETDDMMKIRKLDKKTSYFRLFED